MTLVRIRGPRRKRIGAATAAADRPNPEGRFGPTDTKLFCRLPFSEINIMEDGNVYPNCCPDWVEFPFGNLFEQPWQEIWNGEAAQQFRRSMLDGDLRHCDQHWCPHILDAVKGIENDIVAPFDRRSGLPFVGSSRAQRVRMRPGPVNVGMHYDDSCNLACPTCRDDVRAVRGEDAERMERLHRVVEAEILPGARMISLTGTGDPFASKFLREFLVGFDARRFPKLRSVHLHTNAIMWTPQMWERMPGLHGIDVTTDISIDAARPDTYHVVRQPARWEKLQENLDFIVGIPNLHTLGVSMTVSRKNFDEILLFLELARDLARRAPEKFVFVEYKRARRRGHHTDAAWRDQGLEHLDPSERAEMVDQLRELDRIRLTGGPERPEIRSNLDELLDLAPG